MVQERFGLDQIKASTAGYSLTPKPCNELHGGLFLCWEIQKGIKSMSQSQLRLLSDSSACSIPPAYSEPTLQRKEVRSKGCKHEWITKTLNRNTVAKHIHYLHVLASKREIFTKHQLFQPQSILPVPQDFRICSAHYFTDFPAKMYFKIKLEGLSVAARTAATNRDFTLTLFLIDGFCFSTRMWHHIAIRKHSRKAELDKGGMNAAFV